MIVKVRLDIRDSDALATLRSANLHSYLQATGWTDNGPWGGGRATQYLKGLGKDAHVILVPTIVDTVDYASRMYDAVSTLSIVEERSQLDVFCDLVDDDIRDSMSIDLL